MNNKSAYYGKAGASATVHGPTTLLHPRSSLSPLSAAQKEKGGGGGGGWSVGDDLGRGRLLGCWGGRERGREADDEEEEIQRRK